MGFSSRCISKADIIPRPEFLRQNIKTTGEIEMEPHTKMWFRNQSIEIHVLGMAKKKNRWNSESSTRENSLYQIFSISSRKIRGHICEMGREESWWYFAVLLQRPSRLSYPSHHYHYYNVIQVVFCMNIHKYLWKTRPSNQCVFCNYLLD